MDDIDRFVDAVSALLGPQCPRAQIRDELRAELRAMAHDLTLQGADPEEAVREAVRSMGSVRVLAREFDRAYRPGAIAASLTALRSGALAIRRGHAAARAVWFALAASSLASLIVALRYLYPA